MQIQADSLTFKYQNILKTQYKKGRLPSVKYGFYGDKLTKKTVTLEHLRPVCQGGKTELKNLVLASANKNQERGIRPLAEDDGIKLPVCVRCHTSGNVTERIHDNVMAEKLSKICGQLAWEKRKVAEGFTEEKARELFRYRYGRSYL